ncbi:hypothetical protein PHYBOEH_000888 [Phytophthora boehmeriae]|uniref:Uncharacterized protein n=1 Tax=Phytophthora boehmeriae TaxID=109152 RepID=A0A8T1V8U9_9STRA|nr:hypothetical protein PHYBOEH_000888 [Phytophthora boehmeriae]
MRRPKLVTLSDADNRKRGSRALSESLRGAKLQLRCGSTRCDGELPETATKSYCEAESFRMFLPICDPRPTSNYRLSRKKRENILITMLRRHEHERRNATASRRHSLGS